MKKYWLLAYLFAPSVLLAEDVWRTLEQISYSAVTADFVGEVEVASHNQKVADRYKIYFKEDDNVYAVMKIVAMGKDSIEIIKTDSDVNLYADSKEILLRAYFLNSHRYPNFLPSNPSILKKSYTLNLGRVDKVANRSCQWYWLSPKNNKLYYSIGFCADKKNYFPLTYVYKDTMGKLIEKVSFTKIAYQSPLDSELRLEKSYKLNHSMTNPMSFSWKMSAKGQLNDDLIKNLADNFYIISEKQSTNKNSRYYYLSNGLVYLSLFILRSEKNKGDSSSRIQIKRANIYGPINQIEYSDGNSKIILIGDMPFGAMKQFILNTQFKY